MYNQQQLPVSYQQVNQSTFNNQLPHGNDKVPQIQPSPFMQQNQQLALGAIGTLRLTAQTTAGKTPLHIFAYNLISSNNFQNQVWAMWAEHVVDFTEFLVTRRQYNPTEAVAQAARRIYECYLGKVFEGYSQQLQQVGAVTQQMLNGLQTAIGLYNTILADINSLKQQSYPNQFAMQQQPQQYQQQNQFGVQQQPQYFQQNSFGGNLPPVGANSMSATYQPNAGMQTSAYGQPTTQTIDNPLYADVKPVEEFSSATLADYAGHTIDQPVNAIVSPNDNYLPMEDEVVPINIDDVVVDPSHYQPAGIKFDFRRPYDVIYNKGNIKIYPAYQKPELERTVGDDAPYSLMMDPKEFCLFYVVFPDNVVKEKFIKWEPEMEYLKHELNDQLRIKYAKAEGQVVASSVKFSTALGSAEDLSAVRERVEQEDLVVEGHYAPIVLDDITFVGNSDLEAEVKVREYLIEELNLKPDDLVPAHEYTVIHLNPLDIDESTYDKLLTISGETDLTMIPLAIRGLVDEGKLSIRHYNYLNTRFTQATNEFLSGSLSLGITIEDYFENIAELIEYLKTKRGVKYSDLLKQHGHREIIRRALNLMSDKDGMGVAEYYVNIQTGWTLADMSTLNISKEKAVLVSAGTNSSLKELLIDTIKRVSLLEQIANIRLITTDGYYLQVIHGRLVDKAVLLKRLN